jgi:hydrogenase expression/formation protein HypC
MCLGVPARIETIIDPTLQLVRVGLNGVSRDVNASCVWPDDPDKLVGQWALIHVGFAMTLLSDEEATQTLEALKELGAEDHEMADFSGVGAQ